MQLAVTRSSFTHLLLLSWATAVTCIRGSSPNVLSGNRANCSVAQPRSTKNSCVSSADRIVYFEAYHHPFKVGAILSLNLFLFVLYSANVCIPREIFCRGSNHPANAAAPPICPARCASPHTYTCYHRFFCHSFSYIRLERGAFRCPHDRRTAQGAPDVSAPQGEIRLAH